MDPEALRDPPLDAVPLSADRWDDFERLLGPRGACGGCWCMTPRLTRAVYERQKGEGNRQAMKALVESGRIPGLLGYRDGQPVAWCSIEPRERIPSLARSRILKPVDDRPVWSIVCLFVAKQQRGKGVSRQIIREAVEFAARQGAECVEAYPVEPAKNPMPAVFAYTGIAAAFFKQGFREVARRSPTRPIVRFETRPGSHPQDFAGNG